MRPLLFAAVLASGLFVSGCANENFNQWFSLGADTASNLGYGDSATLAKGIKQALELGSERASASLSATNGFANTGYKIELPAAYQNVATMLKSVGMGSYVTQLETSINRGAEKAAAEALPVFKTAIRNMTVSDALGIVRGNETAATDYFRGQTETSLRAKFQPIIQNSLKETGFYDQYKTLLTAYEKLPLTSKPNLDIESQVMEQSMDALFARIAEEEKLIRANPVGRGSELLGVVFGGQAAGQ